MVQYYIEYWKDGNKYAGPFATLDNARKKAITLFMKKEVPSSQSICISKNSTKGVYGYVNDSRKITTIPGDWVYLTANMSRIWTITPDGKLDIVIM